MTLIDRSTPVQVYLQTPGDFTNIAAIAAGANHMLALKSDGTVWAWGDNVRGQIGNGTTSNLTKPTQVQALSGVVAIAAGGLHSLALKSDGRAYGWGDNAQLQLGFQTGVYYSTPSEITGLLSSYGVVDLAGGNNFTLALAADGKVYTFGNNSLGQLGIGVASNKYAPQHVTEVSNAVSVAAGAYFALAVREDGTMKSWGQNNHGQLGNGAMSAWQKTPVDVNLGTCKAFRADGGGSHAVALCVAGTVVAWGLNTNGQLGVDPTLQRRPTPLEVAGLGSMVDVAAGDYHSAALSSIGRQSVWGGNGFGQVGDGQSGTGMNRFIPYQITLP